MISGPILQPRGPKTPWKGNARATGVCRTMRAEPPILPRKVAVLATLQVSDTVAADKTSELSDALSVRTKPCPCNAAPTLATLQWGRCAW